MNKVLKANVLLGKKSLNNTRQTKEKSSNNIRQIKKQQYDKDDIMSFGKVGVKTADATNALNKAWLYELLRILKNARKRKTK